MKKLNIFGDFTTVSAKLFERKGSLTPFRSDFVATLKRAPVTTTPSIDILSSHKFKLKLKHGDFSGALAISKNSSNRINLLKVVFVSHPLHPNQPVSKKFKVEHSKKYVGLQEEAKLQVQFKKVSEIFK